MKPMVFEGTEVELITQGNEVWVTASNLGRALGYANGKAVQRIYTRNKDEFTDTMSGVVNLTTPTGTQGVRVFSLRGAHLIAMLARTKKAKAFRRWVLDILDTIAKGGEYAKQQWEQARQALEDRREQVSEEGRGLAAWRWHK
ncbi:Bro-N domain-containing protein [Halomonas sp. A40-4]|nr:Bro-N domain-containing protein [Halomonas sp. A40-4]